MAFTSTDNSDYHRRIVFDIVSESDGLPDQLGPEPGF